jgi:hypothetical protein
LNTTWTGGFFGFRTVLLTARERRACIGFVSLEAAQRTTQLDINISCWLICATPDSDMQKFLVD